MSKYWHANKNNINNNDKNQTQSHLFDRFFSKQENNLLIFKHNAQSLVKSSKSFVIDRFVYVSDRNVERGAHRVRSSGEYVPLSGSEFGVELRYLINGDTARVTRKYAILSSLLKNMGYAGETIGGYYAGASRSIWGSRAKLDDERRRADMSHIRMTHVMPYDRLVRNLFGETQIGKNELNLSMEKLNAKYKRELSNKGFAFYHHEVCRILL